MAKMRPEDRPDADSIQAAMEILGERWTFLILREAFYGVRRFSDFQRNLGIARNILSGRLQTLVASGILERKLYQSDPERYEYRLTDKGFALYPGVISIMRWADSWLMDDRPPVELRHKCGAVANPRMVCSCCGEQLLPHDVTPVPGPGSEADVDVAA